MHAYLALFPSVRLFRGIKMFRRVACKGELLKTTISNYIVLGC